MSRRKRKKTNNAVLNFVEVDAPGGILTKSGKRIDGKVLVPDGDIGYGDSESVALMTGDVVARVSTDSKAGDRAYEDALEQATQDQVVKARRVENQRVMAKIPAADMSYDPELGLWTINYLKEDRDTGLMSSHKRVMTDAEAGNMYEQMMEKQSKKGG